MLRDGHDDIAIIVWHQWNEDHQVKYPNRNKAGKVSRQHTAKKRQEETDKLTPGERIARLDQRLGLNVGAKKERAKLNALLKASAKANS